MQIVNSSYFAKQNNLNIPLAIQTPSGVNIPNNESYLDNLCIVVEREIMLNALGLTLYNEFIAITDINLAPQRWQDLVNGVEYDGKVWNGLELDYSLIAYRVYEQYTTETNIRLSATGATKVNAENATNQTPAYLIAQANLNFIAQYQGANSNEPSLYYRNGIQVMDWFNYSNNIAVSLYQYLTDNAVEWSEWNPSTYLFYETKNTYGI